MSRTHQDTLAFTLQKICGFRPSETGFLIVPMIRSKSGEGVFVYCNKMPDCVRWTTKASWRPACSLRPVASQGLQISVSLPVCVWVVRFMLVGDQGMNNVCEMFPLHAFKYIFMSCCISFIYVVCEAHWAYAVWNVPYKQIWLDSQLLNLTFKQTLHFLHWFQLHKRVPGVHCALPIT